MLTAELLEQTRRAARVLLPNPILKFPRGRSAVTDIEFIQCRVRRARVVCSSTELNYQWHGIEVENCTKME